MKIYIDRYGPSPQLMDGCYYTNSGKDAAEFLINYFKNIITLEIKYNIPRETWDEEIEEIDLEICEENVPFLEWLTHYEFYPPIRLHPSVAPRVEETMLREVMKKNPDWVEILF